MRLDSILKERALGIGFDLVGIAPLGVWKDLDFSRRWVERGFGGEMRYLYNPKRRDPRRILPSAKSVICVGLIYSTPHPYSTEVREQAGSSQKAAGGERQSGSERFSNLALGAWGKPASPQEETVRARAWISRYAWGEDYHEIMRAKLEQLRACLEGLAPGAETRAFIDTGPIVERAFARHSGIGWMGKNTCLINEQKGSWFFLGVLLTSLELQPDLPAPDRCGSCTACLEACPTGALVEPYVMDATRCISYLTIELKGSIPEELRPGIGVNVFGCDICQDVCPWNAKNRFQVPGVRCQESGFEPMIVDASKLQTGNSNLGSDRLSAVSSQHSTAEPVFSIQNPKSNIENPPDTFSLFNPPLEALAALTEDDFRKLFAHSAIKRAKYRGWLRNLCVAMGNSGNPRFVPWLMRTLAHPDPIVREHAAWALERLKRRH
jgi:epoxyqueuosine reductase